MTVESSSSSGSQVEYLSILQYLIILFFLNMIVNFVPDVNNNKFKFTGKNKLLELFYFRVYHADLIGFLIKHFFVHNFIV